MKQSTLAIIIAVLLVPVIALIISFQGKGDATPKSTPTPNNDNVTNAADLKDPEDVASAKKVILKTTKGDITINLFPDDVPKTVKNFVTLGKRGYYNNVFFHRIIKDFVIQGGDPNGTGAGGESIFGAKFPDEPENRSFAVGTVAMANSGPNTNGSQFFIVTKDVLPQYLQTLDSGVYTIFGQIDPASQAVVDAIAAVQVTNSDEGRPVNPDEVKMTGFEIVE